MSTFNQASESTKRSWQAQIEFERLLQRQAEIEQAYADKAALERQALDHYMTVNEPNPNASALRGLLFGIPLSMALWAGPILIAGLSRNWWLGALAGLGEVALVAMWARLGRKEPR